MDKTRRDRACLCPQEQNNQALYQLLSHSVSTTVFETSTAEEAVTAFFNLDIAIIFHELNAIHNTIQRMRGEIGEMAAENAELKMQRDALAEQVAAQKERIAELEMEVEGANCSL